MSISIGQYYPKDSFIHKLDSRVKLILTICFVVMILNADSIVNYGTVLFILFSVILLSRVPFKIVMKSVKKIMIIILFTIFVNLFFIKDGNYIVNFYFINITDEGAIISLKTALNLIMLFISSSVLILTTRPVELTNAIEYILSPLKLIKVPVGDIAMMITIAIRFIPTLYDELEKIKKAQTARGIDFSKGSLIKRIKAYVPIVIPMFTASFRYADGLALAMEARCYGNNNVKRTIMKQRKLNKNDILAIFVFLIILILGFGVLV